MLELLISSHGHNHIIVIANSVVGDLADPWNDYVDCGGGGGGVRMTCLIACHNGDGCGSGEGCVGMVNRMADGF